MTTNLDICESEIEIIKDVYPWSIGQDWYKEKHSNEERLDTCCDALDSIIEHYILAKAAYVQASLDMDDDLIEQSTEWKQLNSVDILLTTIKDMIHEEPTQYDGLDDDPKIIVARVRSIERLIRDIKRTLTFAELELNDAKAFLKEDQMGELAIFLLSCLLCIIALLFVTKQEGFSMNKFNADLIGPDNTISAKDTELYSEEKFGMIVFDGDIFNPNHSIHYNYMIENHGFYGPSVIITIPVSSYLFKLFKTNDFGVEDGPEWLDDHFKVPGGWTYFKNYVEHYEIGWDFSTKDGDRVTFAKAHMIIQSTIEEIIDKVEDLMNSEYNSILKEIHLNAIVNMMDDLGETLRDEANINEKLDHGENIKNLYDILDRATHKIVLIRRLLEESR